MTSACMKRLFAFMASSVLLVGCNGNPTNQGNQTNTANQAAGAAYQTGSVYQIESSRYDSGKDTVTVHVKPANNLQSTKELIDIRDHQALINYATTTYPTKTVHNVNVVSADGTAPLAGFSGGNNNQGTLTTTAAVPSSIATPSSPLSAPSPAAGGQSPRPPIKIPPAGVRIDTSISPRANVTAPIAAKTNAVLSVAQSKLGTPYIWGHNEDRGQTGFDCSNFTAYVYHHALGYIITSFSRGQYTSVGIPVPTSSVQPGDLVIFDHGGHVGIYAGNQQVIQEGGGLKKVGYLNVASGSYWSKHITVTKRMY